MARARSNTWGGEAWQLGGKQQANLPIVTIL